MTISFIAWPCEFLNVNETFIPSGDFPNMTFWKILMFSCTYSIKMLDLFITSLDYPEVSYIPKGVFFQILALHFIHKKVGATMYLENIVLL